MAKTPGEREPIRPLTKEEREARKAFRNIEAEVVMNDHEIAKKAFADNRERLKAERLSREAARPIDAKPEAKKAAKPKATKKP